MNIRQSDSPLVSLEPHPARAARIRRRSGFKNRSTCRSQDSKGNAQGKPADHTSIVAPKNMSNEVPSPTEQQIPRYRGSVKVHPTPIKTPRSPVGPRTCHRSDPGQVHPQPLQPAALVGGDLFALLPSLALARRTDQEYAQRGPDRGANRASDQRIFEVKR